MNKKIISFAFGLAFFLSYYTQAQVAISSTINSQNYWDPNRSPFTGQLGGTGGTWWSDVQASGVKYMRVGGIAYDANATGHHVWTSTELASGTGSIIAEIRSYNIEPIIQVSIDVTKTIAQNATAAATLVNDINNTYSRNIIYWEIGNEPDGQYSGGNNFSTDAQIQAYIQAISTAMKGVAGQSGIKIIGPSLSSYNSTRYGNFLGGSADITGSGANGYYIDYISFNIYPFQDETFLQGSTRADVISNITTASAGHFKYDLADLITKIGASGRTTSNLQIAITEANISYQQDVTNSGTRGPEGIGPGSFLGGQFWAEMIGAAMEKSVSFMSFWSVIEGYSGNTYLTDIGYIGTETSQNRPTYWHYQMVAENFSGTYFPNISTATGQTNFKAFACSTATELHVLIMNQDQQSPRGSDNSTESFVVNFDGTTPTSGTMRFAFAAGNTTTYSGGLQSGIYTCSIQKETSMFLAFNKTTGQLTQNKVYSLQDALRPNDVGPNSAGGTTATINSQALYTNYNSANVYTNIAIGVSTGITAVTNNVFQFTNTATVTGPFSSGTTYNTLSILPTTDVTCH